MLPFLQQVTGKAASILVKIYLEATLSQGRPALVPRASVLGPGFEREHFGHRRQQLPPLPLLREGLSVLTLPKKRQINTQRKMIFFFSPAPIPWQTEAKKDEAGTDTDPGVCIHKSVSGHLAGCGIETPILMHTHVRVRFSPTHGRCCPIKRQLKEQVCPSCLTF